MIWANNFDEIESVLSQREDLQKIIISLINEEDIPGKALEGGGRIHLFKEILIDLVKGNLTLPQAIIRTETKLSQNSSKYSTDGRVFRSNWAECLVRIQFSRFYNQGVMTMLLAMGNTQCYVPPTSTQKPDSNCTKFLAGKIHNIKDLLNRLTNAYSNGNFTKEPKIPDHIFCSHVVKPVK